MTLSPSMAGAACTREKCSKRSSWIKDEPEALSSTKHDVRTMKRRLLAYSSFEIREFDFAAIDV